MNKKSGRITIYDIAEAAGVSPSTVSKVLNYPASAGVTPETRERIFACAKDLGYYRVTRDLDKRRDLKRAAVLVPSLSDPHYCEIIRGIEQVLGRWDILLALYCSTNDPQTEVKLMYQISSSPVSGAILIPIAKTSRHIQRLVEDGLGVVALEQPTDADCDKIVFRYRRGGFLAAEHLIKRGCRRIAFVGAPVERRTRQDRLQGYLDALKQYGLPADEALIRTVDPDPTGRLDPAEFRIGRRLTQDLLEKKISFDGIFCINDITAFGAIQALNAAGISVPGEIPVIGFNDIPYADMMNPALSTVRLPAYQMGMLAADMLVRNIWDAGQEHRTLTVEPLLIVRASTANPSANQ